jgi:HD-GYP domain-containing protein (c-di-GMP phosphodiesterase class II)
VTVGGFGKAVASTSSRQQGGGRGILRIGDILTEPLYRRRIGNGPPMLLLAAGHRIESELQLRQLRDEGYAVSLPGEPSLSGRSTSAQVAAGTAAAPAQSSRAARLALEELPSEFAERMDAAARVRHVVTAATRELIGRVRAGAPLDVDVLRQASSSLLAEVTGDASAITTLTYLHACDDYTVEHSADVAILMAAMACVLAVHASELPVLSLAGLMHDVGKQRVPGGILAKPGLLTREEFAEIRMHPQHGFEILADCAGCPEAVRLVALQHHERLDGSGYPNRLTGEQLHPYSRIAAVADTFDAMTADRVYRRGCTPRKALLELYGDHPRKLDPQAVEALIRLVGVYPVGTRVRLNSGEQGLVHVGRRGPRVTPGAACRCRSSGMAWPWSGCNSQ